MISMKFKSGDLVKFVHSSNLLMGIHSGLIGKVGIVIEQMDPDSFESFYLVSFPDRMVSVAQHQIVAATITHT